MFFLRRSALLIALATWSHSNSAHGLRLRATPGSAKEKVPSLEPLGTPANHTQITISRTSTPAADNVSPRTSDDDVGEFVEISIEDSDTGEGAADEKTETKKNQQRRSAGAEKTYDACPARP